ncbi:MAG: AAA family ATPase [Saprospiraceae bacterium]|nr:AAA family ATPase [Saprospiraceae bacterium]
MTIKQLEYFWRLNFKNSSLNIGGEFNFDMAWQLFYGPTDENVIPFKKGFQEFKDKIYIFDEDQHLDDLLKYLHFIGITISKNAIAKSMITGSASYENILRKVYYIFQNLANRKKEFDIDDPFQNNMGDLLYLLKIEIGANNKDNHFELFDELKLPDLYNKYIELPAGYENDKIALKLFDLIEHSDKSIFLTGKAGTGKSTFISYFTKNTSKSVLLFAFTGIAAINIGGQTIHSFFKFPLKPLLPNDPDIPIFNPFSPQRKILNQVETIIIDEVSMLRSDILEGVNYSLRMNGGNPNEFFGGKQIILVGDIFQLPPVIDLSNEVENELFKRIYNSEYFFDSLAYKKLNPMIFEFSRIHRQSDVQFITLLNKIRDCTIDDSGIKELNKRINPKFISNSNDFTIILTTNNYLARTENLNKLNKLPFKSYYFRATINGEFNEDKYPTELVLELRKNTQIILIKNDSLDLGRRWVNGTIATIEFIDEDKINIRLKDGSIHTLQKEIWENRQYQWDKNKGRITSMVVGTFEQYPIKAAWAITIHKSQGLTLENVILDLGKGAFINGQLYTALSRCKSLEGLTLRRIIQKADIIKDSRILNFHNYFIKERSLILEVGDILNYIGDNDYFILRLISTHYDFTIDEIKKYHSILKWGSGVNSWNETHESYWEFCNARYGICFNENIDWDNEIFNFSSFEFNSYQGTGFDERELPLSKPFEIDNLILRARWACDYCCLNNPNYFGPYFEYSSDDLHKIASYEQEIRDNTSAWIEEVKGVLTRDFNFQSLEDFVQFSRSCASVYCLSDGLYVNLIELLDQNNISIKNDILDKLLLCK